MASQSIIVPMDVISQRQMVMDARQYNTLGEWRSAMVIIQNALRENNGVYGSVNGGINGGIGGWRGFYKGFGMSLFTSLPTGTLWWATYSGVQHKLQNMKMNDHWSIVHSYEHLFDGDSDSDSGGPFSFIFDRFNTNQGLNVNVNANVNMNYINELLDRGIVQGISGVSAALVASTLTQPLDVVKTRLQVGNYGNNNTNSINTNRTQTQTHAQHVHIRKYTYTSVIKELYSTSGFRGFFRGLGPRITTMTIWGTVLSSAYEYLRHISRKDYEF